MSHFIWQFWVITSLFIFFYGTNYMVSLSWSLSNYSSGLSFRNSLIHNVTYRLNASYNQYSGTFSVLSISYLSAPYPTSPTPPVYSSMLSFSHLFIYSFINSTPKYIATPVLKTLSRYAIASGKQFNTFFLRVFFTHHSGY